METSTQNGKKTPAFLFNLYRISIMHNVLNDTQRYRIRLKLSSLVFGT